jgi:hypothetical protein
MNRADLCILVPVATRYSWLLPILLDYLKKYWPHHSPVIVAEGYADFGKITKLQPQPPCLLHSTWRAEVQTFPNH